MTNNQFKILLLFLVILFVAGWLYTKRFKKDEIVVPSFLPAPTLMPSASPITASPSAKVK